MVVLRPEAVAAEDAREALRRAPGSRVDDRRSTIEPAEPVDEDADAILLVRDLLDVVAKIRADHARRHDLRLAAERAADLLRRLRGRSRRHPEERRLAELRERATDEEVVGAEVVPPHAHAVHLVDDDETDADRAEHLEESGLAKPLGRCVHEALATRTDLLEPCGGVFRSERRVDERRRRSHPRRELVHLILHQRDERREDERRLRPQHRRELVGQ